MGYLNRMGFFDLLSDQVEVIPDWPGYSAAQIHRGGNTTLVEIAQINKDARDPNLPTRLTDALMISCRDRAVMQAACASGFSSLVNIAHIHRFDP
jgi:hypothetical protein